MGDRSFRSHNAIPACGPQLADVLAHTSNNPPIRPHRVGTSNLPYLMPPGASHYATTGEKDTHDRGRSMDLRLSFLNPAVCRPYMTTLSRAKGRISDLPGGYHMKLDCSKLQVVFTTDITFLRTASLPCVCSAFQFVVGQIRSDAPFTRKPVLQTLCSCG